MHMVMKLPKTKLTPCYTPPMPEPLLVTLYMRPGCHLCDDVADQLEALQAAVPLIVQTVDITGDEALYQQYWRSIPVVHVGETMLRAPIEPVRLEVAVMRAARAHAQTIKER